MNESIEEADNENLLNEAFESVEVDENIAVSDVISFMEAVRAAPDEKITEFGNYFDETASIPIGSFKKIIQDFAEERRNSFTDESAEIEDSDAYQNTTNNLEGCGGDISTVEPDLSELVLRNKNLTHMNTNLRTEIIELRKQLDNYDEECEAHRREIATLDKTLKHFQGSKPDVQFLFKEKDELLSKIHSQETEVSSLQHREKILKEESDDYRLRLSCLQDQYDSITIILDQLRKENIDYEQENNAIKSSCESYQMALDNKEEQFVLKTKECRELQERIEEYESTIEDLQEEKEALSVQVREVQLEYSICQKAITDSAPGTPIRSSIQHELNQADDGDGATDYQSPICGTNYVKGAKQTNSPLTETLRKSLLSSISQGATSPRLHENKIFGKIELMSPPSVCFVENETQTLTTQMVELSAQTDPKIANNISAQTEVLNLAEMSSQTSPMNFFDTSTETQIFNSVKDSIVTEEEDKLFDEQSSKIEDTIRNLRDRNTDLQHKNEELKICVDREKSRSQYLTTQIGANKAKIQGMQELLAKEQEKNAQLADINMKFCTSKMDMWWDTLDSNLKTDVEHKEKTTLSKEMDNEHSSLLIAALCLAESKQKLSKANTNSLHGQDISQIDFSFESDSENCKGISVACEVDRNTFDGRWSVLKLCKDMIKCGISKKIDTILEMMREILFSDDCGTSDNIWDKRKFDHFFTGHVKSLQSLATKLGNVERCIGAREEERKLSSVAEMLSSKVTKVGEKLSDAQMKLQKLFNLALECQCFSAINMLAVLKDIEHNDEVHVKNVRLHTERVREVVDLSGPVIQNQIEQFQKCFNHMDKSLVAFFGRLVPSKIWLMLMCFMFFMYSTLRWEDYHVPPVV